jgi:UDP-3-O-[3-hydroxymyristoyl] glucosamine N-acyltransferase LpxD
MNAMERNFVDELFCYHIRKELIPEYAIVGIDELTLNTVSSCDNIRSHSLTFVKSEEMLKKILANTTISYCLVIACKDQFNKIDNKVVLKKNILALVERPRLEYAILLERILKETKYHEKNLRNLKYDPEKHIFTGKNVEIGTNVIIEPFVTIASNVTIGNQTIIRSGSKILNNVKIGENCTIDENVVIGSQGFGIEVDKNSKSYRIPHLGGVIIGNHVSIGSNTSVESGTIAPTTIENEVKIDCNVTIGHNARIGANCLIASQSTICGSCVLDENIWIGPNVNISNKIRIQRNSSVLIGSIVIEDLEENSIVSGNFATDHRSNLKEYQRKKMKGK